MQSLRKRIYRSGEVEIDLSQRVVRLGAEAQFPRARTFDLLQYLIEHRERVVPREELLAELWQGTAVTSNSLSQCVNEARKVLNDDPRESRFIRTVAKSGYQFIGPVEEVQGGYLEEITSIQVEFDEPDVPRLPGPASISWKRLGLAAGVVCAVAIAILGIWRSIGVSTRADTVIVLPFENSSTSADLDWLREGLADMLITNLGRAPGMNVLGREQVRALLAPGKAGEQPSRAFDRAIAWGRQHAADIVIIGSFGRLGDKVRVTAQVYRTSDGSLQRSESFTADRAEQILTHMDLASLNLAAALGRPVRQEDRLSGLSSLMTPNLEAYRYYSLGLEKADALHAVEAIELFRKATELDPNFAMAHARIGYTYAISWGRPAEAGPSLEKAFSLSSRLTPPDRLHIAAWYALAKKDYDGAIRAFQTLIANNPRDIEAYTRLGSLLSGEKRVDEAVSVLQQAIVIDSNSPSVWNVLSGAQTRAGLGEQAVISAQHYVGLAASEPNAWDTLGLALHAAGKVDESAQAYQRALTLKPGFDLALIHLSNLMYQSGRHREAEKLIRQFLDVAASPAEKTRGYGSLAMIQWRQNHSGDAAASAASALKEDKSSFFVPAWIALERGENKLAAEMSATEEAINERGHRPQNRLRFVMMGRIALRDGRAEDAILLFRKAIDENAPVFFLEWFEDCLADAYLELGRYDEAVTEYQRALKRFPSMALTRYHLAVALERLGKLEQSRTEYRAFVSQWKDADPGIAEIAMAKKKS